MVFKEYILEVVNDKKEIIRKRMRLTHQSHNVWTNDQGLEYEWNEKIKNFIVRTDKDKKLYKLKNPNPDEINNKYIIIGYYDDKVDVIEVNVSKNQNIKPKSSFKRSELIIA
jgi:hypothetical protein